MYIAYKLQRCYFVSAYFYFLPFIAVIIATTVPWKYPQLAQYC